MAKLAATLATYPLQVTQSIARLPGGHGGVWRTLWRLAAEGGISRLYRGVEAKLLQTVLGQAIVFVVYENLLLLVG